MTTTITDTPPTDIAERDPYTALFDLWQLPTKRRRATTIEEYGRVFKAFAVFVDHKPLAELSRRDVVGFRDALIAQGQSTSTANHKVGILRTILRTAIEYELIANNPAHEVRMSAKAGPKVRVAFSADDLNQIFRSEIYTAGKRPLGGGCDAAFWLPLLALFTGARVEELAQLMVKDVRYADGLGHYLYISDEAEHAKLKNATSRRRIPVHPILAAIGFVDYVERQGHTSALLFPHLKANPRGKLGGYFSSFFSVYLRNKVGIRDARKVFHSFRHTFKDVCRAVGIEEAVHDALTGHTSPAVSRKYGNELYPLEPLFEAIEQFEVAGLDLSHLLPSGYTPKVSRGELKVICVFNGIVIAFAPTKPNTPALIIAQCQDQEVAIDVMTACVRYGQLPSDKMVLVNAWIALRRDDIVANWHAGRVTGEYLQLAPLR